MTIYDPTLSDDEWREANFATDVIHSAWLTERFGKSTPKQLLAAAEKYGPDGILESAIMLHQDEYKRVEAAIKKLPAPERRRRARRV